MLMLKHNSINGLLSTQLLLHLLWIVTGLGRPNFVDVADPGARA